MITLFINTAYHRAIISIIKDNDVLFFAEEIGERDLSSKVMPMIDKAFRMAHCMPNDIDSVMVSNGPGSFTGIRVGVTIAKTIAWSLGKKLIPISNLECLASTAFTGDMLVPLIEARRGYVYAGRYDHKLNTMMKDRYIPLKELLESLNNDKNIVFVSDDEFEGIKTIKPKLDILKVVLNHINDGGVNPHNLKPNYMKRTEAEENLEKGLL